MAEVGVSRLVNRVLVLLITRCTSMHRSDRSRPPKCHPYLPDLVALSLPSCVPAFLPSCLPAATISTTPLDERVRSYTCFSLLLRHKHTAAFLNRPHGQHAVVLAEDAHRFTAFRGERDDLSGVNPSSRQIYLTFPAESSFTEEDVTSHFR